MPKLFEHLKAAVFFVSVITFSSMANAGPGDAYSCVTKAQSGLSVQDDRDNPKQRKFYHSSHEKVEGCIVREPKNFRFIWTESGLVFSDLPMHSVWGAGTVAGYARGYGGALRRHTGRVWRDDRGMAVRVVFQHQDRAR